jgi:hypothetical protein
VAEYIVAAALIAVGFHITGDAQLLLIAVGVAMLLLGGVTAAKLGALHVLSRRAHHVGDLLLIAALALCPALAYPQLHLAGTILAELLVLVLLRIERGTSYEERPRASAAASMPGSAAQLAPVAGRAARVGIRSLGIVAGATRRVAREHVAERRQSGDS